MRAEIISVGTEILLGHIVNTNTAYLSKKLAGLGIDLFYHTTVGDNPPRLIATLKAALSRSDIIITTGGLGPTVDDITLSSLCGAVDRGLVFEKGIEKDIAQYFKNQGLRKMPDDAKRQALIPRGALWFKNPVGTAPGILIKHGRKILIALPGPPRELVPVFETGIVPYLSKKGYGGEWIIKTKTIRTAGLVEAEVNKIVKDLLSMGPATTLGIYVHLGQVDLKITTKAQDEKTADRNIAKIEREIRKRLKTYIFGVDHETLESAAGYALAAKRKTLAIAESCTGGLLANRITNISGSSKYFLMGVVAYSNKAKTSFLGVPGKLIKKHGAVSKEVALDMATGIKNLAHSDIGIGVTGIAGPSGGTGKKPVGLVYIALADARGTMVRECHFIGNRQDIKHQASTAALVLLRSII
jgi:nicotinamide-nucleotide amidase